jgi:hypothetical protein
MLRRFAASLLSLSLLTTAAAARQFAQPPATRVADVVAPPDRDHAPSRALIIKALAARRAQNLARFHAYRTGGVYPHDFLAKTTLNVWRDVDGHLCAAATIIDRDGQHALVSEIAARANYVKLGEVTSGPLLDWILTSGFTQVELATIQEPFMGPREPPRDRRWQIAEDARLAKKYARIEKALRENTDDALAQAADRLAGNPALAWELVGDALTDA